MKSQQPKILSVVNYKGGVGKTTVTANLAAEFATLGYRVLMIDTDSQASLTFSFLQPADFISLTKGKKNIKAWFDAFISGSPLPNFSNLAHTCFAKTGPNQTGCLDIVISDMDLIDIDLKLANKLGNPMNYIKLFSDFSESIQGLDYDIVIMDCPPNFNLVTQAAIVSSKKIVSPARPDFYSAWGMQVLMNHINKLSNQLKSRYGANFSIRQLGVIFTMVNMNRGMPITTHAAAMALFKRNVLTIPYWINNHPSAFIKSSLPGCPPLVMGSYKSGSPEQAIQNQIKSIAKHIYPLL